jgi:hypothetical protein
MLIVLDDIVAVSLVIAVNDMLTVTAVISDMLNDESLVPMTMFGMSLVSN